MPAGNPLEEVPVLLIFAVFAAVSFVAYEVGFKVGHWYQARTPGVQEGPTGVLVGSFTGGEAAAAVDHLGDVSGAGDGVAGIEHRGPLDGALGGQVLQPHLGGTVRADLHARVGP